MKQIRKQRSFSGYFRIFALLIFLAEMAAAQDSITPVDVGVVLDIKTGNGNMSLRCINMSLSAIYAKHPDYKTRLVLHIRDSEEDVVTAADAALLLIKRKKVRAMLGPWTSMQAHFVLQVGKKNRVPILSFSATSPSLNSIRSPYYVRAIYNDSAQVKAISEIIKTFGWREVVPIYADNEFGEGIIPDLIDALQGINVRIPYRSAIHPNATEDEIVVELLKLATKPTRVFIVHMDPVLGSTLFRKAKGIGMMNKGYAWILTNGIGELLTTLDKSAIEAMQGVLGIKTYVPRSEDLTDFKAQWKRNFKNGEWNIYGLWAHDATKALAMAVEETWVDISRNAKDREAIKGQQYGPRLLRTLLRMQFKGVSGDFRLLNGQLQASTFMIVNVQGDGERLVGFWTPRKGLVKRLTAYNSSYTNWKAHLRRISWPGGTDDFPKGWEIPTSGKKLRIGVPKKEGFSQFVQITRDPDSERMIYDGFCIEFFKEVLNAMPYSIDYEFIPFIAADGKPAGNYNDLVYQVYNKSFDAIVADTTILANRSRYVDFTLPFMESRVVLVAPVIDQKVKNAWVFLKPLTTRLWVTCACFFFFIGFVVWVLEHRINEDFRGPPQFQVGTMFWFSFSIMAFAHRERVLSNLARFVLIIWFFVVLILTQSYTASLTSLLTLQNLQPTVQTVRNLIENGKTVAYSKTSFLSEKLKELGFHESQLKSFVTAEECHELLTKGSSSGPVSAALIESPYVEEFFKQFCSGYKVVEEVVSVDGFGFVFPIGSPLVADISRAILKVKESVKMRQIERSWLGDGSSCPDESESLSFAQLDLNSFWFLFLLAGAASLLSLLIYVTLFLYKHRSILSRQSDSPRSRIRDLLTEFHQRDRESHTYRSGQCRCLSKPSDAHNRVGAPENPGTLDHTVLRQRLSSPRSNKSLGIGDLGSTRGASRVLEKTDENPAPRRRSRPRFRGAIDSDPFPLTGFS